MSSAPATSAQRSLPTTKGWTQRTVGKVYASIVLSNFLDVERASEGEISPARVRTAALDAVLVDSGASHLCLPSPLIQVLGLRAMRTINVETAAGVQEARLFRGALLSIEDRSDVFSCVELPAGTEPLLGCQVMEALGVIPDVVNHRLVFLPESGTQSYFTAYRA